MGTINYKSRSSSKINAKIVWSEEVVKESNSSKITIKTYIKKTDSYTTTGTWKVSSRIGESSTNYTSESASKYSAVSGSYVLLDTRVETINHKANGTGTYYIYAKITCPAGTSLAGETITCQGEGNLTTILRATVPKIEPSEINAGESITITLNPADETFSHTLTYQDREGVKVIGEEKTQETTFTLETDAQWNLDIPEEQPSMTYKILCQTFDADKKDISVTSEYFTLNANYAYTIPPLTIEEMGEIPSELSGQWIKGYSVPKITVGEIQGRYNAKISSVSVDICDKNMVLTTTEDSTNYSETMDGVINTAGELPITITVKDSRGISTASSTSITVKDYTKPIITSFNAQRATGQKIDEEGTDLECEVSYDIVNLLGNDKKYALYAKVFGSSDDYEEITPLTLLDNYSENKLKIYTSGYTFNVNLTYEVKIEIKDSFEYSEDTFIVGTAYTLMDFHNSGRGVTVGSVAKDDGFNVYMDSKIGVDTDGECALKIENNKVESVNFNPESIPTILANLGGVGFKNRTQIPENSDLNTYTVLGCYGCDTQNTVESLINCPTDAAFILDNICSNGGTDESYVIQRVCDIEGKIWTRSKYLDGAFSDWRKVLNSVDLIETVYPIGSIYITSTNINPSSELGGTWALIDKEFTPENGAAVVTKTSSAEALSVSYQKAGHTVTLYISITNNGQVNDTAATFGKITLSSLGVEDFIYSTNFVGWTDGGNCMAMLRLMRDGTLNSYDVIPDSYISDGNSIVGSITNTVRYEQMLDSACNKFYWKRTV